MYYISKIVNGRYFITDTKDNVTEEVPYQVIRNFKGEIVGVHQNLVIEARPTDMIIASLRSERKCEALAFLDIGEEIEMRFASKPNKIGMVTKTLISVRRYDMGNFAFSRLGDSGKVYKTYEIQSALSEIDWYFKFNKLESIKQV